MSGSIPESSGGPARTMIASGTFAALVAWLVWIGALLGSMPARAQAIAGLEPGRTWTDLGVGVGVEHALLRFQGRQYQSLPRDMDFETALDAVPTASLLLRHWLDRSFGLSIAASLGYLPELQIPTDLATTSDGKQAVLQLWTRELQTQLLYRLHFTGTPTSPALQATLGFAWLGYQVQETDPPVLVSTSYVGPTASAGLHVPLGQAFCLTASAGVFLPFYVLEEPVDSGRLDSSFAWSAELAAEMRLGRSLGLELLVRHMSIETDYTDHGSRGVSGHGVFDGSAQDSFQQVGLNLRYKI